MLEYRDYFEIAYFIAGILVAIVAIIALYQIQIARNTLKTQSQRDSLKLTAEQCKYYTETVLKLSNELYEKRLEVDCTIFDLGKWNVDTDGEEIIVKSNEETEPSLQQATVVVGEVLDLLNAMDSFSVYFISGVADEALAYKTISNSYINLAEQFMPMILFANKKSGHISSLIELYIMWKNRKKHESLQLELSNVHNKMSKNVLKSKKTVGA